MITVADDKGFEGATTTPASLEWKKRDVSIGPKGQEKNVYNNLKLGTEIMP